MLVFLATGCTEDIPMVSLGVDEHYNIYRMQKLALHPALTGAEYRWTLRKGDGTTELLSTSRDYIFLEKRRVFTISISR